MTNMAGRLLESASGFTEWMRMYVLGNPLPTVDTGVYMKIKPDPNPRTVTNMEMCYKLAVHLGNQGGIGLSNMCLKDKFQEYLRSSSEY